MSLTSFARNPRKALRRLPAEGLVLTRPGEPPLRITLADAGPVSAAPVESATGAKSVEPVGSVGSAESVDPAEFAESVDPAGSVEPVESGASERPGVREPDHVGDEPGGIGHSADIGDRADIGQVALGLLPAAQFSALVAARTPWLDDVPPAVLRMVLADVEAARIASDASLGAIDDVLRGWRRRSAAFLD